VSDLSFFQCICTLGLVKEKAFCAIYSHNTKGMLAITIKFTGKTDMLMFCCFNTWLHIITDHFSCPG